MDDREWTDKRLDDRFAAIDRTLQRLDEAAKAVTDLPGKLAALAEDTSGCLTGLEDLKLAIQARNEQRAAERLLALQQREAEQKAAKAERKKDRRWIIATLLATGSLIVAAVALLLGVIS